MKNCLARLFLVATLALSSWGCSTSSKKPLPPSRPAQAGLPQDFANRRSRSIKNVRYSLALDIDAKEPTFQGSNEILFDLSDNTQPLTIDLERAKINSVKVNGVELSPAYNDIFLTINTENLVVGANTVVIDYNKEYSRTGDGLYRFKDPEDGRYYLYTDFEPYDANKVFPCFDQPDLKAKFTLKLTMPAGWPVAVSTTLEESVNMLSGKKTIQFRKTPPISTYLFSVHAGEYKSWSDKAFKIPLRLFARQSMAKYIDYKDWMTLTKQGLAFYGRYFDYPFPFLKYDQLIVPDFNSGAMENIGAVTFSERYIQRGPSTESEKEGRAEVILHEMAHMWFGDLVTMKWWNDLWLNESFATYMSMLSEDRATRFKKAWLSFFLGSKQSAYFEDQLVTTHPIASTVVSTTQAFANFDGITYGKGASTLKLLHFILGEPAFRAGIAKYFKSNEYSNAELNTFISSLEEASGRDLKSWSKEWLTTADVNTVQAQLSCEGDKIQNLVLHQTVEAANPDLRAHRMKLALFDTKPSGPFLTRQFVVDYKGENSKVTEALGLPCPSFVFPNYGDEDYVRTDLDEKSMQYALGNLNRFTDPLMRAMIWDSLWQMARTAKLSVVSYLNVVLEALPKEKEIKIVERVLLTVYQERPLKNSVTYFLTSENAEEKAIFQPALLKLEKTLWKQVQNAKPGSDFQKVWFDAYVRTVESKEGQKHLKALLKRELKLPGFQFDQDRRWRAIIQLSLLNSESANVLRLQELTHDPSNEGSLNNIIAESASPDIKEKRIWFSKIVDPQTQEPLSRLKAAMRGLFPRTQPGFRALFETDFYQALSQLTSSADPEFLTAFTAMLTPALCTNVSSQNLMDYMKEHPYLNPIALKNLRRIQQEDERCVRVRAFAFQSQQKSKTIP